MKETPYQNREINQKIDDLQNVLELRVGTFEKDTRESLARIEMQTVRHNGRMTTIERWQYTFVGALSVVTVVLVPILAWALYVLVNIQSTVHSAVDQALQAYNINVK